MLKLEACGDRCRYASGSPRKRMVERESCYRNSFTAGRCPSECSGLLYALEGASLDSDSLEGQQLVPVQHGPASALDRAAGRDFWTPA